MGLLLSEGIHTCSHTHTLYTAHTHIQIHLLTQTYLCRTRTCLHEHSEKLLVDMFRHTQSHLRPVYRIRATEWLFGLFDLGMMFALIRLL